MLARERCAFASRFFLVPLTCGAEIGRVVELSNEIVGRAMGEHLLFELLEAVGVAGPHQPLRLRLGAREKLDFSARSPGGENNEWGVGRGRGDQEFDRLIVQAACDVVLSHEFLIA